ncbi:MAG: electron transfer flavoprotein subunit alpha/FixB family protein, partial [Sulfobacillus thermotolerans]|nr:electron transfer flavoprotein subunit alpha/FixB family protein [Sulfobacillus thermotolerans]
MAKNILVVADVRHLALRQVTHEMIGTAVELAQGGRVHVLVMGHGLTVPDLGAHGADEVWVVDDSHLAAYTPSAYRKAFMEVYRQVEPQAVLLAHSAVGKDLAPVVSMRL